VRKAGAREKHTFVPKVRGTMGKGAASPEQKSSMQNDPIKKKKKKRGGGYDKEVRGNDSIRKKKSVRTCRQKRPSDRHDPKKKKTPREVSVQKKGRPKEHSSDLSKPERIRRLHSHRDPYQCLETHE